VEEVHDFEFNETKGSQVENKNLEDMRGAKLDEAMKYMVIGDIRPREEQAQEDDSIRVVPSTVRDHPLNQIVGDLRSGVLTRSRLSSFCEHYSFVSSNEPTKIVEDLKDADWVNAMHEELNNFTRNQVWELVERPKNYNAIGTKWVFRNKQNEDGIVVRNKARLVAQGYTQVWS